MIQDILLPEKIGSYYLFGKRIIGLEITKNRIYATVVYFNGSKTTIEQCIEVSVEPHNGETTDHIVSALKKTIAQVGKYNEIRLVISSTQAIFKTMIMPFTDPEKMQRVIAYEVEPLLPFSIADGIIDFVITKKHPQSSEILVGAIQKQYLSQYLDMLSQAGITPDVISIDLFELYGFFTRIYHAENGTTMLLDLDEDATKILFIAQGQLRFIRTLNITPTKTGNTGITDQEAYGPTTQTDSFEQAVEKPIQKNDPFIDALVFTLQSFTAQMPAENEPPTILLLGSLAKSPGLLEYLHQELNMTVSFFDPTRITQTTPIGLKNMTKIPVELSISTAAALSSPATEHINFRQKEFAPSSEKLLLKQLVCSAIFLVIMLAGLLTHSFFQMRTLKRELSASKEETTRILTEWFPSVEKGSIDDMLEEADTATKKDERIWFAFERSARNSLLNLLLELTKLNREGLGLSVEKITIDQERGLMILKASVKDHTALVKLENELNQSNLFTYVQPQNDIDFSMELRFSDEREGES